MHDFSHSLHGTVGEHAMRISAYFNLHRRLFSVRADSGPLRGRVIAHARAVIIDDASCHVSAAGRERVRREQRKEVHAFIRGTLVAVQDAKLTPYAKNAGVSLPGDVGAVRMNEIAAQGAGFGYDPYTEEGFSPRPQEAAPAPIQRADVALLSLDYGNWMINPET
jgi:hypothetical protein